MIQRLIRVEGKKVVVNWAVFVSHAAVAFIAALAGTGFCRAVGERLAGAPVGTWKSTIIAGVFLWAVWVLTRLILLKCRIRDYRLSSGSDRTE